MACRISVPQPGTEPRPQAVKVPSPKHRTARELAEFLNDRQHETFYAFTIFMTEFTEAKEMEQYTAVAPRSVPAFELVFFFSGRPFFPRFGPGLRYCASLFFLVGSGRRERLICFLSYPTPTKMLLVLLSKSTSQPFSLSLTLVEEAAHTTHPGPNRDRASTPILCSQRSLKKSEATSKVVQPCLKCPRSMHSLNSA